MLSTRGVLEPLLVSALELVARNAERLGRYATFWASGHDATSHFEDKVATECALITMLARRVPAASPAVANATAHLIDALRPWVRSDRSRQAIRRCPPLAATLGLGHIYLSAAGDADPSWDRLVRGALASGHGDTIERPPHRLLDRRWARCLAGIPTDGEPSDLLRFSIVRSRAHPAFMTAADAYAYTHTLMYLSDFGAQPIDDAVDRGRVARVLRAALAWSLLEQDFDLLGEFLLCASFLRSGFGPHARLAWAVLERAWTDFGFLPGPTFDRGTFTRVQGDERAAYTFQQVYHTTLVGAVLAAVLLSAQEPTVPDGAPTNPLAGARPLSELIDEAIRRTCGTEAPAPSWAAAARSGVVSVDEARLVVAEALGVTAVRNGDRRQAERALADLRVLDAASLTAVELAEFLATEES